MSSQESELRGREALPSLDGFLPFEVSGFFFSTSMNKDKKCVMPVCSKAGYHLLALTLRSIITVSPLVCVVTKCMTAFAGRLCTNCPFCS